MVKAQLDGLRTKRFFETGAMASDTGVGRVLHQGARPNTEFHEKYTKIRPEIIPRGPPEQLNFAIRNSESRNVDEIWLYDRTHHLFYMTLGFAIANYDRPWTVSAFDGTRVSESHKSNGR